MKQLQRCYFHLKTAEYHLLYEEILNFLGVRYFLFFLYISVLKNQIFPFILFYLSSKNELTVYFIVIYGHKPDTTFPHEYLEVAEIISNYSYNLSNLFLFPIYKTMLGTTQTYFFYNFWKEHIPVVNIFWLKPKNQYVWCLLVIF